MAELDDLFTVTNWLQSLTTLDLEDVVADGGVTAGMVVQQEAEVMRSKLLRFATLPDTTRMDWLEAQHVEVRTPLVHGSRANFHASPTADEGDEQPSDLRRKIDAQLPFAPTPQPEAAASRDGGERG